MPGPSPERHPRQLVPRVSDGLLALPVVETAIVADVTLGAFALGLDALS